MPKRTAINLWLFNAEKLSFETEKRVVSFSDDTSLEAIETIVENEAASRITSKKFKVLNTGKAVALMEESGL